MVIHTFRQSPPSNLHNATTSSTSLPTGFPTQAISSAWTRLSQRKRPPVSSTISYHGCFKSATATAKSSARINLQPQQPVPKLTSTVPSAFAYHATINGLLLIPATTKCAQYSTSSSTRDQSQTQPSRLLASISTSGMRYGNHTLSLRMTSLSTANPSLVWNLMHATGWCPLSSTISFSLHSAATPWAATSTSTTLYTAFGFVSIGQECTNSYHACATPAQDAPFQTQHGLGHRNFFTIFPSKLL